MRVRKVNYILSGGTNMNCVQSEMKKISEVISLELLNELMHVYFFFRDSLKNNLLKICMYAFNLSLHASHKGYC